MGHFKKIQWGEIHIGHTPGERLARLGQEIQRGRPKQQVLTRTNASAARLIDDAAQIPE